MGIATIEKNVDSIVHFCGDSKAIARLAAVNLVICGFKLDRDCIASSGPSGGSDPTPLDTADVYGDAIFRIASGVQHALANMFRRHSA